MPPLRNRLDDIPLLVEAMLNGRKQITGEALSKLQLYDFPGNVRELENIIESAVYTAADDTIEECHIVLPDGVPAGITDILHVENFWDSVARPYADRLITRTHVENVVRRGLRAVARQLSPACAVVQPAGFRLQTVHGFPESSSVQCRLSSISAEAGVD